MRTSAFVRHACSTDHIPWCCFCSLSLRFREIFLGRSGRSDKEICGPAPLFIDFSALARVRSPGRSPLKPRACLYISGPPFIVPTGVTVLINLVTNGARYGQPSLTGWNIPHRILSKHGALGGLPKCSMGASRRARSASGEVPAVGRDHRPGAKTKNPGDEDEHGLIADRASATR
jgi:hypothetical protein